MALVVNPRAGKGAGAAAGVRTERLLRDAGLDVIPVRAPSAAQAHDDLRRALAAGAAATVAVGGDGLVHLVVNALAEHAETGGDPPPLAVVPAGTGNDVARCLAVPTDVATAATRVADWWAGDHAVRRLDVLLVRGRWGRRWVVGVLAAGFDAVVNERANGLRWPRGRRRYDLAVAAELPSLRPRTYSLTHGDAAPTTASALLLAVANLPSYGGGIRISPDSRPDDGVAETVRVAGASPLQIARLIPRAYRGEHLGHPAVTVEPTTALTLDVVDGRRPIVAYGDGERLGPLPVTVEVRRGVLPVIA